MARLLQYLTATPRSPAYAGAAVTGTLVLIFGRMSEDFRWGDRLLIPASGWLRFLLLAVSAAAHAVFLRKIWAGRKVTGKVRHG